MIRLARGVSIAVGLAVLGWQAVNAYHGKFVHRFLIADLAIVAVLVLGASWRAERPAAVVMLAGLSAMVGVFLSATTGRMILSEAGGTGTNLTTAGLVPCLGVAIGLGHWLVRR